MMSLHWRSWLIALMVCVATTPALAQRPTAAQAREILRSRPELLAQLRQRIVQSGMTPEQVRARLRAEGYPEDLLDAYLPGGNSAAQDTTQVEDVFSAVSALGIADSTDLARLRTEFEQIEAAESDTLDERGFPLDSAERRANRKREMVRAPSGPPSDSGFSVFGLSVFERATSQFDPNLAGPVDANYRLGPGDRLVLILTGDVEAAHTLDVTREGFIVIPQVGQLQVANLTLAQLEDLLFTRLRRVYSGVGRDASSSTRYSISVARLRSNQIFVLGDVKKPGSYRVSSAGTALSGLYAAGGPTENGSLRRIEIRRGGKLVDVLDAYDYLLRGDASHDVRLQSGDVVFVPVHGARVRITGEVVRPATYELKPGETLADLLRGAGGFREQASRRRVQIERIVPPAERKPGGRDRIIIDVTAEDQFAGDAGPSFPLQPGDVVRVFAVSKRVANRVVVRGNVWNPGPQGFVPGMKVSDAIRGAGGVKPDVYLGQMLITRLLPDSTRIQLRSSFQDSTGAVNDDLELREDDEIQVFSVSGFRPARYVAISGAVRKGGRFPYRTGMTVRDLVLLAGGLEESAYLNEAEIARLPNERGTVTARTFRVPLDSTYLFERASNGNYSGPPGLAAPTKRAPETPLLPYDNVLILRQPNWELQRVVSVQGEVQFPGQYSLRSKVERVSDLLRRAGGTTAEAYPEGVNFSRKGLGRIGIDLPKILKDPKFIDNLILQDGDSIYIPRYQAVVNVTGAVNSPVAVAYVPGQDIDFYIRSAGGGNKKSDLRRSYVTQPNGKVESVQNRRMLPDGVPRPRAGSVVFVPEKDPADRKDYTASAVAIAQILASLVAIVVVVLR